jgi:hypothetical protein
MERCVKRVMKQGHGQDAATAICYSSIASRLERKEHRMVALKADYGARAGQTIAGNLGRGSDGKFIRAGGGPMSGSQLISSLTAKPKIGKGKVKKVIPQAQQDAAFEKAGIGGDAKMLRDFAAGKAPTGADADRLVKAGLAEVGRDGTVRLTSNARGVLRAAQRGDAQAASDAASRARDAVAKRGDAAAAKVSRTQQRDAQQAQRQADRSRRQSEAEQKRSAEGMQRATDRVEEIEALAKGDKNVTEFERTQRLNRLDQAARQIERAGGNDQLTQRIDALRRQLSGQPAVNAGVVAHAERGSFEVFKAADGWRWLAITSNAFEDRDGEIVSTKALATDADRVDDRGPLRWWHVGRAEYGTPLDWTTVKAGPGVDIGACDFSAMSGRMLIEGGTILPEFAQGVIDAPGAWQMSVGFAHPANEPDEAGAFHNIRVFERSLLPRGKAANPFTAISIQEANMASLKEKMEALAEKFFGGDVSKAEAFAAEVANKEATVEATGVAFKEVPAEVPAEAVKAAPVAEVPAETVKAEAAPAAGDAGADMAEGEMPEADDQAEGGDVQFVGDMTAEEFGALLTAALQQALAPLMESMAGYGKAMDEQRKEAAGQIVALKESQSVTVASIDARVKELEQGAPGQRGYRASQDAGTVASSERVKAVNAPQGADEVARIASFMFGGATAQ